MWNDVIGTAIVLLMLAALFYRDIAIWVRSWIDA